MSWMFAFLPGSAVAAERARWEVTIAVRIEGGTREKMRVRLALPADTPARRIHDVRVVPRGLTSEIHGGEEPYVLFSGRVRSGRRVAVTFVVDSAQMEEPVPLVGPVLDPEPELLQFLGPTQLFQARSILVREFLETHVTPVLKKNTVPLLEAVFNATRREFSWQRDGKSLVLDVIRARAGKRIGIERAFTTFLRCARIPTRFVEGLNLSSRTRKKRVFWTEAWAEERWWPVSASRGWIGQLPQSFVPLARDGARVLEVDGPATTSYTVLAQPLGHEIATLR